MVGLEAELGILPIDIRLQELNRMECLKLLWKKDNALKDKLIALFKNPKPYPSPLQNLAKQGTRLFSHLIGGTNFDINKIRVETEPTTFCKNFTNIERVGPELPLIDTNSEDRKTLHIQFVTMLLNNMKDNTTAIFTDGNSLINPGPTGAGTVIFSAGTNKPPIKLAKAVSSNSTNYHGEIDVILLALKHILPAQSQFNANTIHIFSDSIAAINAITSFSPQEIHHDKTEEIICTTNLLKCFSFNITYSPAHCGITQNEEAD